MVGKRGGKSRKRGKAGGDHSVCGGYKAIIGQGGTSPGIARATAAMQPYSRPGIKPAMAAYAFIRTAKTHRMPPLKLVRFMPWPVPPEVVELIAAQERAAAKRGKRKGN